MRVEDLLTQRSEAMFLTPAASLALLSLRANWVSVDSKLCVLIGSHSVQAAKLARWKVQLLNAPALVSPMNARQHVLNSQPSSPEAHARL